MDLLERFREGDRDAFEVLFRQFQGRIYSWVVRIVRDPGVAEDLTVESFWRIYRARGRFNPSKDFGGWAFRIATNLALNYLRRRGLESQMASATPELAGAERDPAIAGELRDRITRAFVRLPARLRVAATLALVEECSYQEIAQVLGIAEGTVKSRFFEQCGFYENNSRDCGFTHETRKTGRGRNHESFTGSLSAHGPSRGASP